MPIFRSSPRIRSAPQRGFLETMSRMIGTCEVGFRPARRDRHRQKSRNPSRCQRSTVAGWKRVTVERHVGVNLASVAVVHRCHGEKRTRFPCRRLFAAASCCRSSSFSATSAARERKTPTTNRTNTSTIAPPYGCAGREPYRCGRALMSVPFANMYAAHHAGGK